MERIIILATLVASLFVSCALWEDNSPIITNSSKKLPDSSLNPFIRLVFLDTNSTDRLLHRISTPRVRATFEDSLPSLLMGTIVGIPSIYVSSQDSSEKTPITLSRYSDGIDEGDLFPVMGQQQYLHTVVSSQSSPTAFWAIGDSLSGRKINEILMLLPFSITGGWGINIAFEYLGNIYTPDPLGTGNHRLVFSDKPNMLSLRYVLFVPASVVGENFSYFVDSTMQYDSETDSSLASPALMDPSEYSNSAEWIDDPNNFAMSEAINAASMNSGHDRYILAEYFSNFFDKFRSSESYSSDGMNFIPGWNWSETPSMIPANPHTMNYRQTGKCFFIIALNDDIDLTEVTENTSLDILVDVSDALFTYDPGPFYQWDGITTYDLLTVAGYEGSPPLKFSTAIH